MNVVPLRQIWHDIALDVSAGFDFLSGEYRALYERCGATAFQAPLWMHLLHTRLGAALGAEQRTVAVRDGIDGRLLAVFPLVLQRSAGVAIAQFADFGLCDYNGPVADRDMLERLAGDDAFRLSLREALDGADLVLFRKIRSDAFDLARLFETSRVSVGENASYQCDVGTDFDHWRSKILRKKFTKELGRLQRQTERDFGSYEHRLASSAREIGEALEFLRATQGERQRDSILHKSPYYDFYRDFAIAGAEDGSALTYVSYLAGKPVAALFGPAGNGYFHAVLIGVDTQEHARLSPGTQLIYRIIEQRMAQGHTCFDMGLGDPGYKTHFRPEVTPMRNVSMSLSARGAAVSLIYHYSKPLKNVLREFAPNVR